MKSDNIIQTNSNDAQLYNKKTQIAKIEWIQ